MDKKLMKKKRSLLQNIFSVNYAQSPEPNEEDSDYSPGFRNLVGRERSPGSRSPMKTNGVYESAKNSIIKLQRAGSNIKERSYSDGLNRRGSFNNYDFSTYSGQNSTTRPNENKSFSYTRNLSEPVMPPMRAIKQTRYSQREDRSLLIRHKMATQKGHLMDEIAQKSIMMRKRNAKLRQESDEIKKVMGSPAYHRLNE